MIKSLAAAAVLFALAAVPAHAQYYTRMPDGTAIPYLNQQAVPGYNNNVYSINPYTPQNQNYDYQSPGIPQNLGTGQGASPASPYYR